MRAYHHGRDRGGRQKFAAVLDNLLPIAVGKEPEVPDLHKAAGQYMQQEPPDELDRIQGHFLDLIIVLRIAPAKMHTAVLQFDKPAIGNRDVVGIACQIP